MLNARDLALDSTFTTVMCSPALEVVSAVFLPQPGWHPKQVLQQNPAIHGLAPTSHFPHAFCCAHE